MLPFSSKCLTFSFAASFAALEALRFLQNRGVNARMIRNIAVALATIAAARTGKECFEGWRPGGDNSQITGSSLMSSEDADAIVSVVLKRV